MIEENFNRIDAQPFNSQDKKLSDDYETPSWFFKAMNEKFNFVADMACDSLNCKVKGSPLFDKNESGLHEDWSQWEGTKYVFPPFSKPYFSKYLKKARMEWEKGEESVVLVPLKTITVEYFQLVKSPLIYIVYPRIRFIFNGHINSAADSVALLHYSNNYQLADSMYPEIKYADLSKFCPSREFNNGNKY